MSEIFEPQVGENYGQTTVLRGPFSNNGRYWECKCKCGAVSLKTITDIRRAKTTGKGGCNGCSTSTHGFGSLKNPTYLRWQAMKARCLNPSNKSYSNYGGRGIKICDRWVDSFENFLADMGEVPNSSLTNERRDTNGDYCPENCYWATKRAQANNTRSNIKITYKGVEYASIAEACRHFGLVEQTIKRRIRTYGWSVERALSEPTDTSKHHKEKP